MSERGDAERAVALAEELGSQLGRLRVAGPKIKQFLSMVQLEPGASSPGALPEGADAVPFARVRKVIESDHGVRLRSLFDEIEEEPFALASLGQVHRAVTADGDEVAVKVQHPGVAESAEADLRGAGLVSPLLRRLAPGLDAGAMVAELRERIAEELDYEVEAQHQRRMERTFRRDERVRVPRVHTELSTRRVLVTEYVEGVAGRDIAGLGEAERDRAGETAFRFYFELAWRNGVVAGDPHPDNCILCADGRLCLLDFGLLRDVDARGELGVLRAVAAGDAPAVHDGLAGLGYLPDPESFDPDALLEHLTSAGGWMLAPGFRRLQPADVGELLERAYPPRSPYFGVMRRLALPPPTLLLRRMELQLAALLAEWRAGGEWGAIAAECYGASGESAGGGGASPAR